MHGLYIHHILPLDKKIKTEMSGSLSDLDLYRVQVKNVTEITVFILMGFTDDLEAQVFLFLLFLAIYLFTLIGSLGLVFLVIVDSRLHNPKYYFLSVLSLLDACCSSVVTPKMIANFLMENKTIPYLACATQTFLLVTFWDHRVLSLGCNGI